MQDVSEGHGDCVAGRDDVGFVLEGLGGRDEGEARGQERAESEGFADYGCLLWERGVRLEALGRVGGGEKIMEQARMGRDGGTNQIG